MEIEWISVKEYLPSKGRHVWVKRADGAYIAQRIGIFKRKWRFDSGIVTDILSDDKWIGQDLWHFTKNFEKD